MKTEKHNGLKPLKSTRKGGGKKAACDHYWGYDHTIYSTSNDGPGLAIHRQCSKCRVHELHKIPDPKWTRNVRGFQLREL